MATWQLRPAEHPDLSDSLTHFTGRARESAMVAQSIRELSPKERLDSILTTGELWPSVTYSGGLPAVCFTESTFAGLEYLIGEQGFQPWGLVLDRQWVFDQGGAPVWHFRSQYEAEVRGLSPRLQTWAVRLDSNPDRPSDWLHEREWRIPCESGVEALVIDPAAVRTVIVGDPSWRPNEVEHEARMPVDENGTEAFDLSMAVGEVVDSWMGQPDCWAGKPRLCWTTGPGSPGLSELSIYG
ncbi:hypothetical protein ABIA35_009088 [Catenulispora sp. MAP12-49]